VKNEMLIVTTSFFNKTGNQSLFETVKEYSKYYKVTLVTSADTRESIYLSVNEAKRMIPNIRIVNKRTPILKLAKKIKKLTNLISLNSTSNISPSKDRLSNSKSSFLTKVSFTLNKKSLNKIVDDLLYKGNFLPKYICAYEIGAVPTVVRLKKMFGKDIVAFAKFQGTVLGSIIDKLDMENHEIEKAYWMDYQALKIASFLDGCIMTNDGTRGKEVLEKFNVDSDKILFVPNGVSELCEKKKFDMEKHKRDFNYPIKLFTLSRLIYWKRVDLSVKIIAKLVHHFKDQRFTLNIYGPGNKDEVLEIKNLIKKLRVEKYVNYLGSVSYEQTPDVFAKNDILVSLYMMNNITNPVLEAIYYGIPVMTIYKKDLVSIMGERSSSCILLEDSEEERLIMNAANKLNSLKLQDLERLYEEMKYKSTNITTWSNRIKSEISFIENLGGTNK